MLLSALLDSYLKLVPVAAGPRYAAALRLVLLQAYPSRGLATLDCAALTEAAAMRYFTARERAALAEPDQRRRAALLRSANSLFNQARAIFAPRSIARLKRAGHALPDLAPFANAAKKFSLRAPPAPFDPPDDTLVRRTLIAWTRLDDRNMFLAAGHALACGLRAGEMAQARWTWHTERDGIPLLRAADVQVKNQTGRLEVVPLNPFWTIMQRRVRRSKWHDPAEPSPDYILTGTATERADAVFRRASAWLRGLGWRTQKTNHALRDLSASLITMKYGLDHAKHWCRHSAIATTERHYNRFFDPVTMIQRRQKLKWLKFAGEK